MPTVTICTIEEADKQGTHLVPVLVQGENCDFSNIHASNTRDFATAAKALVSRGNRVKVVVLDKAPSIVP